MKLSEMNGLTKAQQNMVGRAAKRDVPGHYLEGFLSDHELALNEFERLSAKQSRPYFGAVNLRGSAQFKVARRLAELGVGRIASTQISDSYYFILEREAA